MKKLKKHLTVLLLLIFPMTFVPVQPAEASNTQQMVNLINKQKLTPEVTGLVELDKEVDRVLKSLIAKGHNTPGALARASYIYLKDSVAYTGAHPLPSAYPQRPIPANSAERYLDKSYGVAGYLTYHVLFRRNGTCDYYSEAYATFLRRIGIPATVAQGHYVRNDGSKDNHAWVVARLSGKYYAFDPQIDDWISVQSKRAYMGHFGQRMTTTKHYRMYSNNRLYPQNKIDGLLDMQMSYVNSQGERNVGIGKYIPMKANASSIFSKKPTVTKKPVSIYINNTKIYSDAPPIIEDGRTLVPLRVIGEALNADVAWYPKARVVHVEQNDGYMQFIIDDRQYWHDDEKCFLDVPATIKKGRTFVPLRVISEGFGADVMWDGQSRSIYIQKN